MEEVRFVTGLIFDPLIVRQEGIQKRTRKEKIELKKKKINKYY